MDFPVFVSTRRLAWPKEGVWAAGVFLPCPPPKAWDLFGYTLCAWNSGDLQAWDAFGFRIWDVGNEHHVKVLLQQRLERFSIFQTGEVTALRVGNDPTHVVVEVTRPYCCERCEWGHRDRRFSTRDATLGEPLAPRPESFAQAERHHAAAPQVATRARGSEQRAALLVRLRSRMLCTQTSQPPCTQVGHPRSTVNSRNRKQRRQSGGGSLLLRNQRTTRRYSIS